MAPRCGSRYLDKFENLNLIKEFDPKEQSPAFIEAELEGLPVLIKHWVQESPDTERTLQEIWLYEVRQLHRLKGCPGVGDFIAPIVASNSDEDGFYLVLGTEDRRPLSLYTSRSVKGTLRVRQWVNNLKNRSNRAKLWRNINRVSQALQILHSQGILHRNLDCDSILTDISSEVDDFQLTGFEWSIRLQHMSDDNVAIASPNHTSGNIFSFLTDWHDLGRLAAEILDINISSICDLNIPVKSIIEDTELILDEINLIRGLIGVVRIDSSTPFEGLSYEVLQPKLESIIKKLDEFGVTQQEGYSVAFLLTPPASNPGSGAKRIPVYSAIQKTFFDAHGIAIPAHDISEFIRFIEDDLRDTSILSVFKTDRAVEEVILLGSTLTYVLTKNKRIGGDEDGSWDCAFCTQAYLTPPRKVDGTNPTKIITSKIACFAHNDRAGQASCNSKSWQGVIGELRSASAVEEKATTLLLGFAAYHLAEIAYAKSEIYPVEIITYTPDVEDPGQSIVRLKSRSDAVADDISETLRINSPAKRFKEILIGAKASEPNWNLVSNINFSEDDQEVIFTFLQHQEVSGEDIFEFQASNPDPEHQYYYLVPGSAQGTTKQLSRRAFAIDALSEHAELIKVLERPHLECMDSHENYVADSAFEQLDSSKKDVFKRIQSTLPLYLVQGPPGVGKTHLVTALVRQAFESEPSSRLLLTAQSHSTVQHLYKEVKNAVDAQGKASPLIVSCIKDASGDDEKDAISQLDDLAREQLLRLTSSDAYRNAPADITKHKIQELCRDGNRSMRFSFMGQLLRSANLVFTTTNSRQIEDLIRTRSQFDWSIMEETGKVTGIELLSPLLLSYRRLMIGDHKQLPPYATEQMRQTLRDLNRLRGALEISTEVYNSQIKGEFIKEMFTSEKISEISPEHLREISSEALRLHLLFESLINEEISAAKKSLEYYGSSDFHRPIASMLSIQHRMHPDIADLISFSFYEGKLKTYHKKEIEYLSSPRPFFFEGNCKVVRKLNSAAIIWIEIPDVQANRGVKSKEEKPTWNNPLERKVLIRALSRLRAVPSGKTPKLALLSPYAVQVKHLEKDIDRAAGDLENLRDFSKPDDLSTFCKTVDSFQGAEADLVAISLVRNNSESYPLSALGFLLDSRRMNVLLSRAKHQLMIIGSYEFLSCWSQKIKEEEIRKGNADNEFLVRLVEKLESHKKAGKMVTIQYEQIMSLTKIS
ncbi:AAA domain-containing protein [Azotobacter bryophylli]|uniref:AAA domain-containing protein n=1 Tax=Azotobacter bryophylli TaxID=1986537 RepID=A0ABV7AYN7_9GAMM